MLPPITKEMIDYSTNLLFEFSFHCDVCRKEWRSTPIPFSKKAEDLDQSTCALLWQVEHDSAYERANQEAIRHFNRCPRCGKMVCNDCFILDADPKGEDLCIECASTQMDESKKRK